MRRLFTLCGVCVCLASAAQAEDPPPFAFEWVIAFPPGQMATDSEGNLWVINTNSFVIQRTTRDGHILYPFPFASLDVCRNTSGNMFMMSSNSYVVLEDSVSIIQAYIPPTGSGIAANANGEVFIASSGRPDVLSKYSAAGYLLRNHSLAFAPQSLALGQNGVLFTLDPAGGNIVRFDAYTRYIDTWPGYDTARDLATDPDGNLYVLWSDHITKLSPDGTLLADWGEAGDGPGQFRDAVSVTFNDSGDVYVADRSTRRILMFGTRLPTDDPPPPPPPPPPDPTLCPLAPLTQHPPLVLLHVSSPPADCLCRGPGAIASVVTSADPSLDGSTHHFVYLVASPGEPGLLGFESAVGYRPHRPDRPGLEIVSWHACADLELPEPAWPDSGAGNTFTWESCLCPTRARLCGPKARLETSMTW